MSVYSFTMCASRRPLPALRDRHGGPHALVELAAELLHEALLVLLDARVALGEQNLAVSGLHAQELWRHREPWLPSRPWARLPASRPPSRRAPSDPEDADGQRLVRGPEAGGRTRLTVNACATGLKHPRWLQVLPNGDVPAAEALTVSGAIRSVFDYAMVSTMKRAAALGDSPNRIIRLRDADGDGVAEVKETFLAGLNQPFGMALLGDTFYVGNTDGVVAFPYDAATASVTGPARPIATFKPGGHWTRSLLPSPDGTRLYVGVGSLTNIGDHGMATEEGRAAIWELDLASGAARIYAGGLRNPVGLAWEPTTNALWTVVNERDGLGDETPPTT